MATIWRRAEGELRAFQEASGATEDAVTWSTELVPVHFDHRDEAIRSLASATQEDGLWSFIVLREPGGAAQGFYLAMPVNEGAAARPEQIMLVELFSRAAAWWLTSNWRISQLARSAAELAESHQVVAAAACTRALVETVAAMDDDAQRLVKAWAELKASDPADRQADPWHARRSLVELFTEISYGSKFTKAAPKLKEDWTDRVSRKNVLTQLKHFVKRTPGVDLAADYEWLCNVVHPSVGTTFVFSSPPFMHETNTHSDRLWSAIPTHVVDLASGETSGPGLVQEVIARSAAVALGAALEVSQASLRVVDDIALTSSAGELYRRPTFRSVTAPGRNDECPCGSGLKWKRCIHEWGRESPEMPTAFTEIAWPGESAQG